MAADGKTVATTFAIQIGLALIVFFLFSWLRLTKSLRRFYAPKRFDKNLRVKPKRLPPGFFAWWWSVYCTSEDDLIEVAGLDAAVYVRLVTFGAEVFTWVSIWCLIVVLPANLTGHVVRDQINQEAANALVSPPPPSPPSLPPPFPPPPPADCNQEVVIETIKRDVTLFDVCSISNIDKGSRKLWVHLISVYVVSIIVLNIMWRYNDEASLLRIMFLANSPRGGPSHTVLVTEIPGLEYGTFRVFLRGFVGGTLFIMLPKSMKHKIMDFVESGVSKARGTIDITSHVSRVAKAKDQDEEMPAFVEKQIYGSSTGMSMSRRKLDRGDKALDVWQQAVEHLGELGVEGEDQEEKLKDFILHEMEFCYGPGHVAAINPIWDQNVLQGLLSEFNKVKTNLEDYLDKVAYQLKRRKTIKKRLTVTVIGATMGNWGIEKYGLKPVKVDAITFWCDRLRELMRQITEAQKVALTNPTPAAFITFNTRSAQVRAATSLHHHSELYWNFQPAPDAAEIVWSNLLMRSWQRASRTVSLWMLYLLLIFFYIIPVVIVQGLVNIDTLATYPVISTIVNWPFINQILKGILPTIVMVIFLALMPSILAFMCRMSGYVSLSTIDFGVVTRYFYFQVIVVFFYNMIAGTFINQYKDIINHPSSLISTLGVAIPQTATFFITYILTAGVGKSGIQFLRIVPLVIFLLLSRLAATPRARARMWSEQYRLYGPVVPYYTICFFLAMVYCCINPIICPTVLLFFLLGILSEKYTCLYTYKSEFESGGKMWGPVFHQFMTCVYAMQIFMMVLLGIKGFRWTPLLVPMLFFTLVFHITVYLLFSRPWSMLSVHDAAMLDIKDQEERGSAEMTQKELQEVRDMYLSPVFKVGPQDIEDLLHEAAVTSGRIDGKTLEDMEQQLEDEGYVSADEADYEEVARVLQAEAQAQAEKLRPVDVRQHDEEARAQPVPWRLAFFGPRPQQATPQQASSQNAPASGAAADKVAMVDVEMMAPAHDGAQEKP